MRKGSRCDYARRSSATFIQKNSMAQTKKTHVVQTGMLSQSKSICGYMKLRDDIHQKVLVGKTEKANA